MALLNIPQAAEYLGVGERMVRRLVEERRITFVKVGKYVRFSPKALDRFIEENTVDPARGRWARGA